jgi:hypothetical protein
MQQEGGHPSSVTFVGLLNVCASTVALKEAGAIISRLFIVDGIQISLCAIAWLTCMQSVGASMSLGECSTTFAILKCDHLECHDIGTCGMQ